MSDTARTIRVVIDSKGAQTGAARVNQALSSIGTKARQAAANNNELSAANDKVASSSRKASTALNQQGSAIGQLRKLFGEASGELGRLGSASEAAAGRMGTFAGVARGIAGMGVVGVLGGIGIALTAVGVAGLNAAAQVQQFKANLATMTGSAEAAESAYAGLVQFAKTTPFTLDQSVEGFTKLRSLGLSTSKDIMTSYGNTAAAMGKDMSQMIEAVADATTGEFERLKEFGIKASQQGDKVSFTFQGVTKTVSKNAADIEKYLISIGQTQFAGAMDRQMKGLNGAFSNLEDTIFQLLATLGDGPFGAAVADIINTISSGVGAITPLLSGIMDIFGGIVSAAWDVTKGLVSMFTGGSEGATNFQAILDGFAVTFSFIGEWISMVGSIFGQVFRFIGDIGGMVAGQLRSWFGSLLPDMSSWFQFTGQSAGESLVGILRAGQFVAQQLPSIFKVALNELKTAFGQLGTAIAAALTGDFSKFKDVDLSFKGTKGLAAKTWTDAGKIQRDQKANRAWIDSRTSKGIDGNIDYSATRGAGPAGKPKKEKEDKKAKQQEDFWKGLERELELSKLTTLEAEKRSKEMDYEKIVGRAINAGEKERLTTLLEQTKTFKFIQTVTEQHRTAMIDINKDQEALQARLNGLSEEELAVKKAIQDRIAAAAKEGITLNTDQLKLITAQADEEARKAFNIERQNKLLTDGIALGSKYSFTQQGLERQKNYNQDLEAAALARTANTGTYSKDVADRIYRETVDGLNRAVKDEANQFRVEFGERISDLGEQFGGTFGKAISKIGALIQGLANAAKGDFSGMGAIGSIANLLGTNALTGQKNDLGKAFQQASQKTLDGLFSSKTWSDPMKSMSDGFNSFKGLFSKGGDFTKSLGSVLGNAGAGAQIGGTVAGLANALGIGLNGTGAQVGGAIGGAAFGPIGSIAGSILGGVVGNLFKKAKWGTASVVNGQVSVRGNKESYKDNAETAGNTITSSLDKIAEQFGADLGNYSVSIGQYKGKWRVSTTGRTGKLKGGSGRTDIKDFGKDGAEDALRYAIQDAIKDGALMGVRASTQALLKKGDDVEAQLEKALKFEGIFKDLKAMTNPAVAAVDDLNLQLKSLSKLFQEAGATSEEYAQFEQYRQLKIKQIIEDQTSSFNSLLKDLNGTNGGVTELTLLNQDLAEFQEYKNTINSGGTVDQSAFTTLAQEIFGYAGDLYGTNSSQFQSIRADLLTSTNGALTNVANAINSTASQSDATTVAITDQTTAITSQINTTNSLLQQILSKMSANRTLAPSLAVNGALWVVN